MSDRSELDRRIKELKLERVKELMKQHEAEAEVELDEQFQQQVPAHVVYFLAVVIGAFVLNLLVLMLVSAS